MCYSFPLLLQWNHLRYRYNLQLRSLQSILLPTWTHTPCWQHSRRGLLPTFLRSVRPWSLYCYLSSEGAGPTPCIWTLLRSGQTLWPGRSPLVWQCAVWLLKIRLGRAQMASQQLRATQPPMQVPRGSKGCVQSWHPRAAPLKLRGLTPPLRWENLNVPFM